MIMVSQFMAWNKNKKKKLKIVLNNWFPQIKSL